MKYTLRRSIVLGFALAQASTVNAQSAGPTQITIDGAMKVPSKFLAIGYQMTTDRLPLIELAKKGMGLSISELGTPKNINKENAGAWLDGYKNRQEIYARVIESRGYVNVSGNYDFHTDGDCGARLEGGIKIAQSTFQLLLTINDKSGSTGTIVENQVVVNVDGTVGDVPYWIGEVRDLEVVLTDQSGKCNLVLSKR
jgi:hypothetical protein